MSILDRLSSQVGDRSEASNRQVVMRCLEDPSLLDEIAAGLQSKDAALDGDCAEVFTLVAEQRPDWVAPYAAALSEILKHKTTRVRWEAMHALALSAADAPQTIEALLPALAKIVRSDPSIIVRDYAVDAIAGYAATDRLAAEKAYPLLSEALTVWEGRHAGHALRGLTHVAAQTPARRAELKAIAVQYASSEKAVVRNAAKELCKAVEQEDAG